MRGIMRAGNGGCTMTEMIATVENGILRLGAPLPFADGTQVKLIIDRWLL